MDDAFAPGDRPLHVDLVYGISGSEEAVVGVAQRFIAAGYESVTGIESPLFSDDSWEVSVGSTGVGGMLPIRVRIVDPDRDAAETLAPLMDALGTVPQVAARRGEGVRAGVLGTGRNVESTTTQGPASVRVDATFVPVTLRSAEGFSLGARDCGSDQ